MLDFLCDSVKSNNFRLSEINIMAAVRIEATFVMTYGNHEHRLAQGGGGENDGAC
jgi:hypothetical protein